MAPQVNSTLLRRVSVNVAISSPLFAACMGILVICQMPAGSSRRGSGCNLDFQHVFVKSVIYIWLISPQNAALDAILRVGKDARDGKCAQAAAPSHRQSLAINDIGGGNGSLQRYRS